MKIKQLLTKTLLVAAGLCVGANAWGDEVVLNPTADTYFGWDSNDEKATSFGSETTLRCGIWQEYWTNATPGLRNGNNVQKIAVLKFDLSEYKGKITGATLKVTATNTGSGGPSILCLGFFDRTDWTESTTTSESNMVTRHATNLNIHQFGTENTTAISKSLANGTTNVEQSISDDLLTTYLNNDEDGIVSLILYSTTREATISSKEAATGKPSLTLTYTDETLYTASFTANSGAITPTVTIYSDAERETPVSNGTLTDKTTYYYRAVLAGYNNNEGSFTVNGANPSVSFTMTAKTRYTFTVNAVDAGSNVLKTIYTDADSYEGKSHNIVYPKYLTGTGNIVTYSKDNNTYGENKTAQAQNETYAVSYTAYDGVAYFVEVEDVVSATAYGSWNCSNGGAVRGFTTAKDIFTVPATGVYDITYAACNNNVNYDLAVTLSKNETEIATKSDLKSVSVNFIKTTGIVTNNNVSLASGDVLKLTPSTTNGIIDYMLVELKSVPVTIASSGFSTIASAYPLDCANLPDGLTAYKVTSVSATSAALEEVDVAVDARTGLILEGTPSTAYDIPVAVSGTEDISSTNKLKAAVTETPLADKSFYILKGGKFVLVKDTESEEARTVPAGKAYLLASDVSAPELSFDFGGATGISEIETMRNVENETFFDLQGRKVAQPTKGLYIVNGKKVVIK